MKKRFVGLVLPLTMFFCVACSANDFSELINKTVSGEESTAGEANDASSDAVSEATTEAASEATTATLEGRE